MLSNENMLRVFKDVERVSSFIAYPQLFAYVQSVCLNGFCKETIDGLHRCGMS